MNIPQNENLIRQIFNSEFIEFIWKIPYSKFTSKKFLLHIEKNLSIYMTSEWIPTNENQLGYTNVVVFNKHCKLETLEQNIMNPKNWDVGILPQGYNYFSNGKDLIILIKEVIKYLK